MSVSSVESRSFILTLFIRDDGERFLLGDKGYEFSESQLHFNANVVENDEVEKQGTDGTMLAGQVRRSSVQTFDGYIGDGSTPTDVVEQMRRDFFAFFAKDHFYRAIYIDCNRNAWQRKGGYIVDAPEVKELYQITPEYHVGLNFEDVNYYTYDENEEGEEILGDLIQVEVSHDVIGGLVWDENGAVIEDAEFDSSVKESTGSEITINDAVASPFNNIQLQGNTEQTTYTGKNLFNVHATPTNNTLSSAGITATIGSDGTITTSGTSTATYKNIQFNITLPAGTYKASGCPTGGSANTYSMDIQVGSTQYYDTGNGVEFTLTASTQISVYPIRLGGNTGINMTGKVFKPMITVSTADQSFEPYVGGTASPNPDYPQTVKTTTGRQVVEVVGKNLAPTIESTTLNGVSISVDSNGVYTLNGTATANTTFSVKLPNIIPLGAQKTMSLNVIGGSFSNGGVRYRIRNSAGVYSGVPDTAEISLTSSASGSYSKTITNELAKIDIWTGGSGTVLNNFKFNIQLELGNSKTDFEPYQGYSHEINLGKNLFDKNNANIMEGYFSAGGSYLGNGTDLTAGTNRIIYIECKPNTTYTITKPVQATTSRNRFRIATSDHILVNNDTINDYWRDSDGTTNTVHTITTGNVAKYLYVYIGNATSATVVGGEIQAILDGIQIELGSQASEYAPYFSPIELCKLGTYQDYIYKDNDKWYVHKEVGKTVLNGSESGWQVNSTYTTEYMLPKTSIGITLPQNSLDIKSDYFTATAVAPCPTGKMRVGGSYFVLNKDNGANLANFKTWLGANKPSVYYALATPTDTEITYEPLVEQLNNLQWGGTLKGSNNIVITSANGNATGSLQVIYYTKHDLIGGGYVWEQGGGGGSTIAINNSITSVSPIWTVKGTVLNPLLENTTTGEYIQYVGLVAEGQTLVVDMGEQTALLDGINVLSNIVGDFITLKSGANTLLYSVEGDAEPSELGWSEIVG